MAERNASIIARMELVGLVIKANPELKPYPVAKIVYDLGHIAKTLHKRYENMCNYPYANTDTYLLHTEKLEEKAVALGCEIGVTIGHQRDPRGWPLIVMIGAIEHRLG